MCFRCVEHGHLIAECQAPDPPSLGEPIPDPAYSGESTMGGHYAAADGLSYVPPSPPPSENHAQSPPPDPHGLPNLSKPPLSTSSDCSVVQPPGECNQFSYAARNAPSGYVGETRSCVASARPKYDFWIADTGASFHLMDNIARKGISARVRGRYVRYIMRRRLPWATVLCSDSVVIEVATFKGA